MNKWSGKSYCRNCNKTGHHNKTCTLPITSFGIICHTKIDGEQKFLMVKRKYSYAYVELVCGWTTHQDEKNTGRLVSKITASEQNRLISMGHDQLWKNLWGKSNKAKEEAAVSFNSLQPHLTELFNLHPSKHKSTEWGMPKGRRNLHEKDEDCAIREFIEETGFGRDDFIMDKSVKPLQEDYTGDDGKNYRHIYFIASSQKSSCMVSPNNWTQNSEIAQISWLSIAEIKTIMKSYQSPRMEVLKLIDLHLKKL